MPSVHHKAGFVKAGGRIRQEFDGTRIMILFSGVRRRQEGIPYSQGPLSLALLHQNSTASNPESKMYAFEAGSVIMAHYERNGNSGGEGGEGDYGIYHTTLRYRGTAGVRHHPNKDHSQDLDVRAVPDGIVIPEPGIHYRGK